MLQVDKQKLQNTILNDGRTIHRCDGSYCIKGALLNAAGYSNVHEGYEKMIGYFTNTSTVLGRIISFVIRPWNVFEWRREYPKLSYCLDRYEERLMGGSGQELLQEFIAELEKRQLVQFTNTGELTPETKTKTLSLVR